MNEFNDGTAEVVPFPDTGRPVIRYVPGRLPENVDEAEQALIDAGAPVYSRGSALVTPGVSEVPTSDGGMFRSPRLKLVSDVCLVESLTQAAYFKKYDARGKKWRTINCPREIAQTLISRERWRLPALAGILSAPSLRGDGSPLVAEGFDVRSRLILDFCGWIYPPMPAMPTREDARHAFETICEAFSTFPAKHAVDRSVIASALMTSLVRRSLPTAPLHAITAHAAGSGKSLLADMVSLIATGRPCPVMALGRTAEESEKRLGAVLLEGNAMVSLDNIDQPLSGDFLAQALTQQSVKVRILGESRIVETPTGAMILATGNNLRVAGDLTRRCLVTRLDPGCEQPEIRRFERNALNYARDNRGRLVVAGLTVMRAYALAGHPIASVPLGSFEAWSSMVRDAIIWAGGADPVRSMEVARAGDPEREILQAIMWAWHARLSDNRTTVAQAIEAAAKDRQLHQAFMAPAGERGEVDARRLGKWLARVADRLLLGARFVRDGERQGVAVWRLVGFVGTEGTSNTSAPGCQ